MPIEFEMNEPYEDHHTDADEAAFIRAVAQGNVDMTLLQRLPLQSDSALQLLRENPDA